MSKFGASALLNISAIYSNEVFPTDLRGRAIAICSFVGKFGGIIAPMLVELSEQTLLISAFICILSCLVLMPLENTFSNSYLVDSVQEVEDEIQDT
jgi:MFS family permease